MKPILTLLIPLLILTACAPASTPTSDLFPAAGGLSQPASFTPAALAPTETQTSTPLPPTATDTATPTPTPVDSLKAAVAADKLVCRYGPGANYLYLIAFNKTTPLRLIGRAAGNDWVLVENGQQDCWVNSQFIEVKDGDPDTLRSVYPDGFKLIVSPYYGPTTVLSAAREGSEVTITWMEVVVSPGKYENEAMFPYLVEVWVCRDGEIVFDTLGSRVPFITVTDEPGCAEPSHGRVYIQEKHGYAGPAEIPWPGHE
ncbi:MAG: hypothetical protein DPW18_03940 [Chloroflexi bacterium]|nr:hypothetical protein [Chloroflexota bacterium]MDL1941167.1 hypothetical protein [Chloroflexi bacterium CFX2]